MPGPRGILLIFDQNSISHVNGSTLFLFLVTKIFIKMRRVFQCSIAVVLFLSLAFVSFGQNYSKLPYYDSTWSKPYEPFRIAGNLYYVGTYDLACYLITTPTGHVLINSGLAESPPLIRKSVERLGFKFTDIKILLTTQIGRAHV